MLSSDGLCAFVRNVFFFLLWCDDPELLRQTPPQRSGGAAKRSEYDNDHKEFHPMIDLHPHVSNDTRTLHVFRQRVFRAPGVPCASGDTFLAISPPPRLTMVCPLVTADMQLARKTFTTPYGARKTSIILKLERQNHWLRHNSSTIYIRRLPPPSTIHQVYSHNTTLAVRSGGHSMEGFPM